MSRLSIDLESKRSEGAAPQTLTVTAGFTVDLDWLRSESLRRNLVTGACLALVVLTFFLSLGAALRLKMHSDVPYWVSSAVPPALSRVAYGHAKHYMSLNFVHEAYYGQLTSSYAKDINRTIADILLKYPVANDHSDRVLPSDDRGIVDLTEISFRIFGYRIEGVLYLYYIVLGLSAALYAYSYRRNPFALLLLAAFLLLHRMILPMIKYDAQLNGLTALRCMPILAMIACMHGILFHFEQKVDRKQMAAFVLQVAIIVFVMHIRSTAIWELVLVIGAGVLALLLRKGPVASWRTGPSRPFVRRPVVAAIVSSLALFSVLKLYLAYGFPEEYYREGQSVTRVFWHNIYSGLVYSPGFAQRDDLRIDDFTTLEATQRFLKERGREKEWDAILRGAPDYTKISWRDYDQVVKEMFFVRCAEHSGDCAAAFLYYKPVAMMRTVFWVYGFVRLPPDLDFFTSKHPEVGVVVKEQFMEASRQLDIHKERGRPWFRRLLFLVAAFAGLAAAWRVRRDLMPVIAAAGALAAGSMVPSVIGYPAPHTIAEAALAIPLLLVALPAWIVLALYPPQSAGASGTKPAEPNARA